MNTTFTAVLKKKNKDDKYGIINIRIIQNRISKYHSLKILIKENQWNKNYRQVKSNHPEHEEINTIIEREIKQIKQKFIEQKDPLTLPKNEVSKRIDNSFMTLFSNHKKFLLERNRIGTYKCYNTAYQHLENYIKSIGLKDLLIDEVNGLFVRDFETYLLDKVSLNSCNKYLSTLKKVYKEGIILDIISPTKKDPFLVFENKREKVHKPSLVKMEVEILLRKEIEPSSPLFHTRNYFLFQIFGQGLRVSDLFTLRWENFDTENSCFKFLQQKTKKTHTLYLNSLNITFLKPYIPELIELYNRKINIEIENGDIKQYTLKELQDIHKQNLMKHLERYNSGDKSVVEMIEPLQKLVSKYEEIYFFNALIIVSSFARQNQNKFVFPILNEADFSNIDFQRPVVLNKYQFNQIGSKNAQYNKRLKELQKLCEIHTPLTSHLARHTYTNLMIDITENDILAISKSLGHQKLSTTQQYINEFSTEKRTENANKAFIGEFK